MAQDGDSKIIKPNLIKFGHQKYSGMKKTYFKMNVIPKSGRSTGKSLNESKESSVWRALMWYKLYHITGSQYSPYNKGYII